MPWMGETLSALFHRSSDQRWGLYANEILVRQNHAHLYNDIKKFFEDNQYYLSAICLDLLMDYKKNKKLKDGITPAFIHELRPIMNARVYLESGLIPWRYGEFGRAGMLFAAVLIHDLGEDFGLTKKDLKEKLNHKINEIQHLTYPDKKRLREAVDKAANIMEYMTFERKYTPEKAREIFTEKFGPLSDFSEEAFKNFILKELFEDESDRSSATITTDKKGKYVVSRYGGDWNRYITAMMQNPWAIMAKFFDRCEGLSTRVGVDAFDEMDNRDYLQDTRALFMHRNTKRDCQSRYPALARAFECIDATMGILHHSLDIYHIYTKPSEIGKRTFDPQNARPADFSKYRFSQRVNGLLPSGLDFISVMMSRIYAVVEHQTPPLCETSTAKERLEELSRHQFAYQMLQKGLDSLHKGSTQFFVLGTDMKVSFSMVVGAAYGTMRKAVPVLRRML